MAKSSTRVADDATAAPPGLSHGRHANLRWHPRAGLRPLALVAFAVSVAALLAGGHLQGPAAAGSPFPGMAKAQPANVRAGSQNGPSGGMPTGVSTKLSATNVVLGRPTASAITLSVLPVKDTKALVLYGKSAGALSRKTSVIKLSARKVREVLLRNLAPNTRYYYRLVTSAGRKTVITGTFRTQRAPGSTFTFTITADPHLDKNTDPALWRRTLANVAADAPDFHIDLGDTFMTDKYGGDRAGASRQYLAQRCYFAAVGRTVPLYLALGNHDGESLKGGGAQGTAVWSNTMRKTYFPNPRPNAFYSGDTVKDSSAGLLEDYYAWEWGSALFVVLDPYWNSSGPKDDGWGLTLGDAQYAWLRSTLAASDATYKFVFIHQLAGGLGQSGRGGSEVARFGEWGGRNQDGSYGFAEHRPGWEAPIHDVLVGSGVTAVFHGHDHLYAKQDLGGVVYQEVPQPAQSRSGGTAQAAEYGYTQGVILGSSGYLRVTVSPGTVTARYVRSVLTADQGSGYVNRQVAHSYTVSAPQPVRRTR
jgi:hypothetical protein